MILRTSGLVASEPDACLDRLKAINAPPDEPAQLGRLSAGLFPQFTTRGVLGRFARFERAAWRDPYGALAHIRAKEKDPLFLVDKEDTSRRAEYWSVVDQDRILTMPSRCPSP